MPSPPFSGSARCRSSGGGKKESSCRITLALTAMLSASFPVVVCRIAIAVLIVSTLSSYGIYMPNDQSSNMYPKQSTHGGAMLASYVLTKAIVLSIVLLVQRRRGTTATPRARTARTAAAGARGKGTPRAGGATRRTAAATSCSAAATGQTSGSC